MSFSIEDATSRGSSITTRSHSRLDVSFVAERGRTRIDRVFESGALRLRRPNGAACQGIIVNTGGGIVGGDRLASRFVLGADADVTLTTVAAEKIYRSAGADAAIATSMSLASGARLDWLPQETILFDESRVRRSAQVDMVASARFLAAEMVVFGRVASAEATIQGVFHDSWRIRRDGRLVFADETRLDGAMGDALDRPAVGNGARAVGLVLLVAADAERFVDSLRTTLSKPSDQAVEFGVSARDGILIARFLAREPQCLRATMLRALSTLRGAPLPRVWT